MLAGEDRPAVHREGRLAALAAVDLNPAAPQSAERAGVVDPGPAPLTPRATRVQVFHQPCFTDVLIQQVDDREFHARSLARMSIMYDPVSTVSRHEPRCFYHAGSSHKRWFAKHEVFLGTRA